MDVQDFIDSLRRLDAAGIVMVARELEESASSAAGEVSWWRAILSIDRELRANRAGRRAACAARLAISAVIDAATASGMDLPDDRVTAVARAAADVARGLEIQASAAHDLLRSCRHLVAA